MDTTVTEEGNSLYAESSEEEELGLDEKPPTASLPSELIPVSILKPPDLQRAMDAEISGLAQVSCIPPGSIRIVLDIFKWDKEKILEKTMYGESFLMLRDIGIIVKAGNGNIPRGKPLPEPILRSLGDCLICHRRFGRTISFQDKVITSCEHWFCQRCFQQYVHSEVESGDSSHLKCPFNLCRMFLDESLVIKFMPGTLFDRFQQLRLEDFVKCSKYRQMCPTIDCNRSAYLDVDTHTKRLEVECDCGATYCFGCGEIWHYPLTCEQLKKWTRKFGKIPDYSMVVNIQKNKMPCPRCSVIVENSSGRAQIVCSICNLLFCWSCLHDVSSWKEYHSCPSHMNTNIEPEVLGVAAIQRDFERAKDKFSVFDCVDSSVKNLGELKVETTSDNLTERVCNIIVKSQQFLRCAYVYTYFLETTLMKYNFLKLLHKFEGHLDTLMEELEGSDDVLMMRLELEVRNERAILLQTISDGLENDSWHFKQFQDEFY